MRSGILVWTLGKHISIGGQGSGRAHRQGCATSIFWGLHVSATQSHGPGPLWVIVQLSRKMETRDLQMSLPTKISVILWCKQFFVAVTCSINAVLGFWNEVESNQETRTKKYESKSFALKPNVLQGWKNFLHRLVQDEELRVCHYIWIDWLWVSCHGTKT